MKHRVLFAAISLLAVAFALFAKLIDLAAPVAAGTLFVPSVTLALVAIAAVAAVLASVYHPALFSWRQCAGTPFDDSNASFMAGSKSSGKGKGKGGGGKK